MQQLAYQSEGPQLRVAAVSACLRKRKGADSGLPKHVWSSGLGEETSTCTVTLPVKRYALLEIRILVVTFLLVASLESPRANRATVVATDYWGNSNTTDEYSKGTPRATSGH